MMETKNQILVLTLIALIFVLPYVKSIMADNADPSLNIPTWVKNSAKWWSEGTISDGDFIKGIQYLIQQGVITLPATQTAANPSQTIPTWVKNSAKWWSEGTISDGDFVKSLQYMVQNGIIQVGTIPSSSISTTTPATAASQQLKTFHDYGFSFNYPADWTIEDVTSDKNMPYVKIHSNDSSTTVSMGLVSGEKAFADLTGQAYLDTLISYYKSGCISPTCSNFNLTYSNIVPYQGGSMYLISFNSIKNDTQGNKTMYTLSDADMPLQNGTWVIIAQGPSANYALYKEKMGDMITSLNFDVTPTSSAQGSKITG